MPTQNKTAQIVIFSCIFSLNNCTNSHQLHTKIYLDVWCNWMQCYCDHGKDFSSGRCKTRRCTCASTTRNVRWTRRRGSAVLTAASRSVSVSEWGLKVGTLLSRSSTPHKLDEWHVLWIFINLLVLLWYFCWHFAGEIFFSYFLKTV